MESLRVDLVNLWREAVSAIASADLLLSGGLIAQLAVVAGLYLAAFVVARRISPAAEDRIRRIRGQPRLLRLLALVLRRLDWLLFAAFLWLALAIMEAVPTGWGTSVVRVAALLVSAWAVISIASRIVRNRAAARAVAIVGWLLFALAVTGILEPLAALLDAKAFVAGGLRVSLLSLIVGIGLLIVLTWGANVAADALERRLRRSQTLTPSVQELLGKLAKFGLFALAILIAVSAIGVDLTALTVFSGAIGLGLGFGLQKVVSNFVSGVIILADKSIKPGDVIQVEEFIGHIRSLRARFVSIVTRDGREILIPNEDFITQRVINWSFTDTRARLDVNFGTSYASDPHQVRALAREAAAGTRRVLPMPAPVCHIVAFGESSIDFVLRFWIEDAQNGLTNVRGDVFLALWDAFKEAGIEIPFPQRDVHLKPASAPETPAGPVTTAD